MAGSNSLLKIPVARFCWVLCTRDSSGSAFVSKPYVPVTRILWSPSIKPQRVWAGHVVGTATFSEVPSVELHDFANPARIVKASSPLKRPLSRATKSASVPLEKIVSKNLLNVFRFVNGGTYVVIDDEKPVISPVVTECVSE